ncbi:UbiA prenyltransferase family protein [Lewinella sp. LCG006]|uniref:UbiA prenyltransferase family protein n=1 Tax=Lewinella sp. LCG006 TaxID=3231911 RepID=UPI003460BD19
MKTFFVQFTGLLRVRHWVKNGFVFIPAIFAKELGPTNLWSLLLVGGYFCLSSSVVYIFNDLLDVEKDRRHPTKKFRPIASGYFTSKAAVGLMLALLLIVGLCSFKLPEVAPIVGAYLLLNIAYSLYLKYLAIVDVAVLGIGFVLRVLAGGVGIGVFVSEWLVTIVFLLCTALGFAKRRHDLAIAPEVAIESRSEPTYTLTFLDRAITIMLTITLMAYIIYSLSPVVMERLNSDKIYLTSFFVFLGTLRYLLLTLDAKSSGSPVEIIYRDRVLQLVILGWATTFYLLIY